MPILRTRKWVITVLLVVSMLMIPIAAQEKQIPTATYEIINGEESGASDSVEIAKSPCIPMTSLTLLNDSLLTSNENWFVVRDDIHGDTEFIRTIAVPELNVSAMTVNLSISVVTGPVKVTMVYGNHWENTICQSGEHCELDRDVPPIEYEDGLIYISIKIGSVDWDTLDYLFFSIRVEFSLAQCPVTIDLERTNGESMFLLQEFSAIVNRPTIFFSEERLHLSKANDTLYLPNGNYSLSIDWRSDDFPFTNVSTNNESLIINIKIKSVRLNVESIQKIPGLAVYVGGKSEKVYLPLLLKDSPSFYLHSRSRMLIEVAGELGSLGHQVQFRTYLDAGYNRNITLLINENWILVGGLAFTPARLIILIAAVFVIIITLLISRKKLISGSIYLPFTLMFLASIMPSYQTISEIWWVYTLPLFSVCIETELISLGIDISAVSLGSSTVAVTKIGEYMLQPISQTLFIVMLIPFIGVIYEYLRKEWDSEFPDFLIGVPMFLFMLIQWLYVVGRFAYAYSYPDIYFVTIGPGPILASLAIISWIILYKRKGGLLFTSIPMTDEERKGDGRRCDQRTLAGCVRRVPLVCGRVFIRRRSLAPS